tara:strand:+ start:312 stop:485 length:174 start_codon:yes stop_codon:yes gene_type:complete
MTKITEKIYIKKILQEQVPKKHDQKPYISLVAKLKPEQPKGKWCGCCYESELNEFYN